MSTKEERKDAAFAVCEEDLQRISDAYFEAVRAVEAVTPRYDPTFVDKCEPALVVLKADRDKRWAEFEAEIARIDAEEE